MPIIAQQKEIMTAVNQTKEKPNKRKDPDEYFSSEADEGDEELYFDL